MSQTTIPSPALSLVNGQATCLSTDIAKHFGKQHKNVLRDLEALDIPEDFNRLNFEPVEYIDAKGEKRRAVRLTRDGFTLLAMWFTGKKAMAWKVRYIEAFNAMEDTLKQGQRQERPHALPLTPSTVEDRRPLKEAVNAWVEAARSQGKHLHHAAVWKVINLNFNLERIDQLPAEWVDDAVAYVREQIPKALASAEDELADELKDVEDTVTMMVNKNQALGQKIDRIKDRHSRLTADAGARGLNPDAACAVVLFSEAIEDTLRSQAWAFEALRHASRAMAAQIRSLS